MRSHTIPARKVLLSTLLLSLSTRNAFVDAQLQEPILGEVQDEADCHNACTALLNELGDIVHYGPSSKLKGFSEGYFSIFQREVVPACVVTPSTAQQVSLAVSLLRTYPCPIAVKSGGHAPAAGFSNSPDGITFDLKLLDQVEYLGAKDWNGNDLADVEDGWKGEITRVGTGNKWFKVYETLDKHNVSVVGGRAGTVGVGGFALGGGISFLSQERGWSVDTIRNYEIVLPNGTLTNVNHASNPTLFRALRGGGNNFGIVTRFDMETFPQGKLWGGYQFWLVDPNEIAQRRRRLGVKSFSALTFDSLTHFDKVGVSIFDGILRILSLVGYNPALIDFVKAFEGAVVAEDMDLHSHLFLSFAYVKQLGTYLFGGQLVHTKGVAWPEIFKPFQQLKKPLYSNMRLASPSKLSEEVTAWSDMNSRQKWQVTTLRATPLSGHTTISLHELLNLQIDIFIQEIEKIKHVRNIIPAMTFQPINLNEIRHMSKNGGNAIGLTEEDGPLIILSMVISYGSRPRNAAADDEAVRTISHNIFARCEALAKEHGMWHPFRYINYADKEVDAFAGYGEEKREWLRKVKKEVVGKERWDIGGFKV